MKTKPPRFLNVLLPMVVAFAGLTLAGQTPAGPKLPTIKIGSTVAECSFVAGAPLNGADLVRNKFTEGGWDLVVVFNRGRVVRVEYLKPLKGPDAIPKPELDALLKLSYNDWTQRAHDFDKTDEDTPEYYEWVSHGWPSMTAQYGEEDSYFLSVRLTNRGFNADSVKARNRLDAREAWGLGVGLGSVAGAYLGNPDAKAAEESMATVKRMFQQILLTEAARAADPKLTLPSLPAKGADTEANTAAIFKHIGQCNAIILKAIGPDQQPAGEPGAAACYELGLNAMSSLFILEGKPAVFRKNLAAQFGKTVAKSHLPTELWAAFLEKAGGSGDKAMSAAEFQEVFAALQKAVPAVTAHLDGKIQASKEVEKQTDILKTLDRFSQALLKDTPQREKETERPAAKAPVDPADIDFNPEPSAQILPRKPAPRK